MQEIRSGEIVPSWGMIDRGVAIIPLGKLTMSFDDSLRETLRSRGLAEAEINLIAQEMKKSRTTTLRRRVQDGILEGLKRGVISLKWDGGKLIVKKHC
jgi:hypothetical protein